MEISRIIGSNVKMPALRHDKFFNKLSSAVHFLGGAWFAFFIIFSNILLVLVS